MHKPSLQHWVLYMTHNWCSLFDNLLRYIDILYVILGNIHYLDVKCASWRLDSQTKKRSNLPFRHLSYCSAIVHTKVIVLPVLGRLWIKVYSTKFIYGFVVLFYMLFVASCGTFYHTLIIFSVEHLGTIFIEIWIQIEDSLSMKIHLIISSPEWQLFIQTVMCWKTSKYHIYIYSQQSAIW